MDGIAGNLGDGLRLAAYGLATVFSALIAFALLVKLLVRIDGDDGEPGPKPDP